MTKCQTQASDGSNGPQDGPQEGQARSKMAKHGLTSLAYACKWLGSALSAPHTGGQRPRQRDLLHHLVEYSAACLKMQIVLRFLKQTAEYSTTPF